MARHLCMFTGAGQGSLQMTAVSTMPEAETALLLDAYRQARVILEFGSGASTSLAAQMSGKYILSVESDRLWARQLRAQLAAEHPKALASVFYVDIGPTGAWGRPIDDSGWRRYPNYPNAIWDQPFFRHPDVILIDGRFRPACLMAAMLHITRPVRVLFDDYADRPLYHQVEKLVQPEQVVGRMAEFRLTPGMMQPSDLGFAIAKFFEVTVAGKGSKQYALRPVAGSAGSALASQKAPPKSPDKTDAAPRLAAQKAALDPPKASPKDAATKDGAAP